MSALAADSLPEGQQEALEALRSIAQASDGALTVDLDYVLIDGGLNVRVYLSSASLLSSGQGIVLEDWEPIDIAIPEGFPYRSPIAWTGRDDFPDLPHQAWGSKFCVRVEPGNWDHSAGMSGFMRAVIEAYQHISLGTLQGHLQAWRPMVAFRGEGCAVVKADLASAGAVETETYFRWAVGIPVSEDRIDITKWLDITDHGRAAADLNTILVHELNQINEVTPGAFLVPVVLVTKPVALEYSDYWVQLLVKLQENGIDCGRLLDHLARAAAVNPKAPDGHERALVLFQVAADTELSAVGQDARFAVTRLSQHDAGILADLCASAGASRSLRQMLRSGDDSLDQMLEGLSDVTATWVRVYDGRPESLWTRTAGRSAENLAGTAVLLLGCGGLGAPIAEHCVRSGVARLQIVDSGTVNPGILSRQPYEDADIGKYKAEVLAARLGRIYPGRGISAAVSNLVVADIASMFPLEEYDLVIDATANRSVAAKIERYQRDDRAPWPTLITVVINQQATHGVAAVTPKGSVGAGIDLLRRLGLKTCMSTALSDVYEAFFPARGQQLNFRADTSCSDTTFIGSATDISALAAQLLDSALARLKTPVSATDTHRSLSIIRLGRDDGLRAARVVLDLPPDHVIMDQGRSRYEVRVDKAALETIQEYIRASANGRIPGSGHTGGLLLGQFDSTSRIAWVSEATGLPQGSSASPLKISLDVRKVRDFLEDRSSRTGGMLTLIGFWHAHPGGSAAPSDEDRATMRELVAGPEWPATPALLLIAGVRQGGSVGDSESLWAPEIHAEAFTNES
jgi:proteasome lid subunit RPN8/RPN11